MTTSSTHSIGRQVILPTTKAIEIAYKGIRLRLFRSLLVTSGIVLAVAFLMSTRTTQILMDGMRNWEYRVQTVRAERLSQVDLAARDLRERVESTRSKVRDESLLRQPPKGDIASLNNQGGPLPVPAEEIDAAIAIDPGVGLVLERWMQAEKRLEDQRHEYSQAQMLIGLMAAKGVPTSPEDIAAAKVESRWIIGVSLMVALVGIVNSMLMSVTERFREIGTMKCLGALDIFILKIFFVESLLQGAVGTFFGILCGLAISFATSIFEYPRYTTRNLAVADICLNITVCFLAGVGLTVAGALYPAWQAARMQPIEAMRTET